MFREPSFCIYNSQDGFEEEENRKQDLERCVTLGDSIGSMGSGEFSFGQKGMGLIEEEEDNEQEEVEKEEPLNEFENMGIVGTGGGYNGGGELSLESVNLEEYYDRIVLEDPSNPLFLRNYAQFLLSKGDLLGAEEYYYRATLADPQDGEILMQYAKLVWELHHDQDRALSYFEFAAQAAPEDSHIHAAYASFLWEVGDKEEEDCAQNDPTQNEGEAPVDLRKGFVEEKGPTSPRLHLATGLGIEVTDIDTVNYAATSPGRGDDVEEFYKRMVKENPFNPLFLGNYAKFLLQSGGDLQEAKEYFSLAILADPGDGETISQYAKLVWELDHDRDKAISYFERAIQATPEDSNVLAAYARFLWETDE